jgi:hypothetical protein
MVRSIFVDGYKQKILGKAVSKNINKNNETVETFDQIDGYPILPLVLKIELNGIEQTAFLQLTSTLPEEIIINNNLKMQITENDYFSYIDNDQKI